MAKYVSSQSFNRLSVKTAFRNVLAVSISFLALYSLATFLYTTQIVYKVRLNFAYVIETFSGDREVVSRVGWHMRIPIFTEIEQEIPLMNRKMLLGKGSTLIVSNENSVLKVSAAMTYKITDIKTWAIENLYPLKILQNDFNSIVIGVLQSEDAMGLISERNRVKQRVFDNLKTNPLNRGAPCLEKKYGIKIVSFVLTQVKFRDKMMDVTQEKKRREMVAESDNYAADEEASAIRKVYKAYGQSLKEGKKILQKSNVGDLNNIYDFLVQQRWASVYDKQKGKKGSFIVRNGSDVSRFSIPLSGRDGYFLPLKKNVKKKESEPRVNIQDNDSEGFQLLRGFTDI